MTEGQFASAAQSALHIAGTAAATLAAVNPAIGALAQTAIIAAGALVTFTGAVWSYLTPPAHH